MLTRADGNNPSVGAGAGAPNNDAPVLLLGVPNIGAASARAVACAAVRRAEVDLDVAVLALPSRGARAQVVVKIRR